MCYRVGVGLGRAAQLGLAAQGHLLSERVHVALSCLCSLGGEEDKFRKNPQEVQTLS